MDTLGGVKISPPLTPPRRLAGAPTVGDIALSAKMVLPWADSGCGTHKATSPTIEASAERAPAADAEGNASPASRKAPETSPSVREHANRADEGLCAPAAAAGTEYIAFAARPQPSIFENWLSHLNTDPAAAQQPAPAFSPAAHPAAPTNPVQRVAQDSNKEPSLQPPPTKINEISTKPDTPGDANDDGIPCNPDFFSPSAETNGTNAGESVGNVQSPLPLPTTAPRS